MAVERIVSLLPSATEMLYLLGCGDRLVGVSHECNYPAAARSVRQVTRSHIDSAASSLAIDDAVKQAVAESTALYEVDFAALAELRPNLIVTQAQCDVCAVRLRDVQDAVESIPELRGARLLTLSPTTLDDVFGDLAALAEAAEVRADDLRIVKDALDARMCAVQQCVSQAPARPRVTLIEWIEPLMAAGNWTPQLLSLAGGEYVLAEPGAHSPYVQWEALRRSDPDVLLIAPCGFDLPRTGQEAESLWSLDGWRALTAVREGRAYLVDGDAYFNRSGPRLVDSLEIAAHLLHPEHFADLHPSAWREAAPPAKP